MAAKDVEYNIEANDNTSRGVDSARRNFESLDKDTKRINQSIKRSNTDLIKHGSRVGALLGESLVSGINKAGPAILPAAAGLVAAAAPVLGAGIAGAIIGGAGIGGVIGGLVVASRDQRVQTAAEAMGSRIEARLNKAGGAFVQPAIAGMATVEKAVDSIDLEGIFRDSARYVPVLAGGISRAITSLGDGIEDLVSNAGPAVDAIADGIGSIGDALGTGLSQLADNGQEGADALRLIFGLISTSISGVFNLVNALTELYGILDKIGAFTNLKLLLKAMGYEFDSVADSARKTGEGTFGAADGIQKAGDAASGATPPLRSADEAMAAIADTARGLFDATTSVGESMNRATEAAKKNGQTLSSNTEKGRANRQALSGLAQALNNQYQATIKTVGAGYQADVVATNLRGKFIKLATQMTGSASKARALADQLLGIPNRNVTVKVNGVADAKAAARTISATLRAIRDETVNINYQVNGTNSSALRRAAAKNSAPAFSDTASSFFAAEASDSSGRGIPAVPVTPQVDVSVYLEGRLIDARIDYKIRQNNREQSFNAKTGRAY